MSKSVSLRQHFDVESMFKIPTKAEITSINQISPAGPRFVNLRDNDAFSGQAILVNYAEIIPGTIPDKDTGAIYDYVRAVCFIYPPSREPTKEDGVILQCGAGEVARRLTDAIEANAFPVKGILHKHGRAWSIED